MGTPGPTKTGESFTKVAGKLSEPNTCKSHGRRNTMNGLSVPRASCPSGSVRGPARRLVTQSLPKVRRMTVVQLNPPLRNSRKKKRKKKRRRKRGGRGRGGRGRIKCKLDKMYFQG